MCEKKGRADQQRRTSRAQKTQYEWYAHSFSTSEFYLYFGREDNSRVNSTYLSSRECETIFHKFRVNRGYNAESLHCRNLVNSPLCLRCNIPDTPQHYLLECSRYTYYRLPVINVYRRRNLFSILTTLLAARYFVNDPKPDLNILKAFEKFLDSVCANKVKFVGISPSVATLP